MSAIEQVETTLGRKLSPESVKVLDALTSQQISALLKLAPKITENGRGITLTYPDGSQRQIYDVDQKQAQADQIANDVLQHWSMEMVYDGKGLSWTNPDFAGMPGVFVNDPDVAAGAEYQRRFNQWVAKYGSMSDHPMSAAEVNDRFRSG